MCGAHKLCIPVCGPLLSWQLYLTASSQLLLLLNRKRRHVYDRQSVPSTAGKLSCNSTTLKRCTNTRWPRSSCTGIAGLSSFARVEWDPPSKILNKFASVCADHRLNGSSSPVLTATHHSYGKGQNSTLYKIETPERILTKFGTIDYVPEICLQTKFGDDRISGDFWINVYFFPESTWRPDPETNFHVKRLKRRRFTHT